MGALSRSRSLRATRAHLRPVVAGLMLAALAALVLHGALAGLHRHGRGGEGWANAASATGHAAAHAVADHHQGTRHLAALLDPGTADAPGAAPCAVCGCLACSVTLLASGAGVTPPRVEGSVALAPADDPAGAAASCGGPRRPPRTLGIA